MTLPTYSVFRPFAIFAGVFSIVGDHRSMPGNVIPNAQFYRDTFVCFSYFKFQSLIWIGFAITGIIAYYCDIDFSGQTDTMGSLLTLTFFNVYFRGKCSQGAIIRKKNSHPYPAVIRPVLYDESLFRATYTTRVPVDQRYLSQKTGKMMWKVNDDFLIPVPYG